MVERRILHCEDDILIRKLVERVLPPHIEVVAFAPTLEISLEQLELIRAGKLDVNVLLLDGKLKGYKEGDNHPKTIVDRAAELGIQAARVGLSGDGLVHWGLELGVNLEADITKTEFGSNLSILGQVLDHLPAPQTRTP